MGERELKFVLHQTRVPKFLSWLSLRCEPDPLYPAGTVSSVYYDNPRWCSLSEKRNSDYLKAKFRLRWYADLNNERHGRTSFLEAKHKIGSRRLKVRIEIDWSGVRLAATPLESRLYLSFLDLFRERGIRLPSQLLPALQIDYKRRRFRDPVSGGRLCIDYDIHASRVNPLLLARCHTMPLATAVCEYKGDVEDLPASLYPLTAMGCRRASFSKYSACYRNVQRHAA
jgi:hypothetical protein